MCSISADTKMFNGHADQSHSWSSNRAKGSSFNPTGNRLNKFASLVASQGRVKIITDHNCPPNLNGSYSPSEALIRMCVQNFSNSGEALQTLLHEATHRAQHCRGGTLAFNTTAELKRAFNALPQYHQRVVLAHMTMLTINSRKSRLDLCQFMVQT